MRRTVIALTAVALGAPGLVTTRPAQASESCSAYRATCEAVCTPERADRYYAGSMARCASSCTPRWNQCLRTGWWADLEARYGGSWERAEGW